MPASVIGKSLNLGYPGNESRIDPAAIKMNRPVKTTVIPFGAPVKLNTDGTYDPLIGTDAFAAFAGVAIRNVKQQTVFASNAAGQYNVGDPCDVMEKGFITVPVNPSASLTSGGAVYAAFSGGVFQYFDSATSTGAIQLTNCKWVSNVQDGNNVAELAILTQNMA